MSLSTHFNRCFSFIKTYLITSQVLVLNVKLSILINNFICLVISEYVSYSEWNVPVFELANQKEHCIQFTEDGLYFQRIVITKRRFSAPTTKPSNEYDYQVLQYCIWHLTILPCLKSKNNSGIQLLMIPSCY
jgi:hypothetical protein